MQEKLTYILQFMSFIARFFGSSKKHIEKKFSLKKLLIILFFVVLLATTSFFIVFKKITVKETAINDIYGNSKIYPIPQGGEKIVEEKIQSFSLPILMYHNVRDYNNPNDQAGTDLSVSPENFDKQMQWLSENNFETVNPTYFVHPFKMAKKPIVITFDDGYQDNYDNALPILKKYHFQGTIYVITDKINTPGYLTWNEILELENEGMNIGSHSVDHQALTILPQDKLNFELSASKKILEENTGESVEDLAYPYGKHNDSVANSAKEAGYQTATDTKRGLNNEKNNPFRLMRLTIRNDSRLSDFPELGK